MILIDLNVVLDVVQKREPHYRASAGVLAEIIRGSVAVALPAHGFTTLHDIVGRYRSAAKANDIVDWLLRYFDVATAGRAELLRARELNWPDFEDAVVAASAEAINAATIITRNVADFQSSPVPSLTPEEYLLEGKI